VEKSICLIAVQIDEIIPLSFDVLIICPILIVHIQVSAAPEILLALNNLAL